MWKRSVATAMMLALATSSTIISAASASAQSSTESQFVSLINQERASRGRRALAVRGDLVAVARRHSARMAAKGRIWHNPNLSREVDGWRTVGENVGVGPSVQKLHNAFMNSSGHRANIVLADYNQIGVGVVLDGDTIYVTEVFAERGGSVVRHSSTQSRTPVGTQAAARPVARPKAVVTKPKVRTVDVLLRLVAYDAESFDPEAELASDR